VTGQDYFADPTAVVDPGVSIGPKTKVFGKLESLPAEIAEGTAPYDPPTRIPANAPNRAHQVLLCEATRV
jgi:hypothetical protein